MLKRVDEKLVGNQFNKRALYISTTERQKISIWPTTNYVATFIGQLQTAQINGLEFFHEKYGFDENHHTMPLVSFYNGLNQIFNGYMLKQGFQYDEKPSNIEAVFSAVSARLGGHFLPPESVVDFYAGDLFYSDQHQNIEYGIEYFEINARNYPGSIRAWGRLGFAYAEIGDIEAAINALNRALEIDPNNNLVRNKLQELQQP